MFSLTMLPASFYGQVLIETGQPLKGIGLIILTYCLVMGLFRLGFGMTNLERANEARDLTDDIHDIPDGMLQRSESEHPES